jgi:phenylalanyl-tRNA synthetase beta chain
LPLAPVLFEVDAIALQRIDVPVYKEISRFQAVTRDLALVVKQTVEMQALIDTFISEKKLNPVCNILQVIVLFDEYRGKGLESDEKSLAFRFTLQDTQSTLQDDLVDAAMAAFVAAAGKHHGARLRA